MDQGSGVLGRLVSKLPPCHVPMDCCSAQRVHGPHDSHSGVHEYPERYYRAWLACLDYDIEYCSNWLKLLAPRRPKHLHSPKSGRVEPESELLVDLCLCINRVLPETLNDFGGPHASPLVLEVLVSDYSGQVFELAVQEDLQFVGSHLTLNQGPDFEILSYWAGAQEVEGVAG